MNYHYVCLAIALAFALLYSVRIINDVVRRHFKDVLHAFRVFFHNAATIFIYPMLWFLWSEQHALTVDFEYAGEFYSILGVLVGFILATIFYIVFPLMLLLVGLGVTSIP